MAQRIEIPLPDGSFLVAEAGQDPNFAREIYIFRKNPDGTEQDIICLEQKYDLGSDGDPAYIDNAYRVLTVDKTGDFEGPSVDIELANN
jgi:hypothetical protein